MTETATYDGSIVDEVVEPSVSEYGLDLLDGAHDRVVVVHVQLDHFQPALRGLSEFLQRGGIQRVSRCCDDEVLGRLEKTLRQFKADSARAAVELRGRGLGPFDVRGVGIHGVSTHPVMSQVY